MTRTIFDSQNENNNFDAIRLLAAVGVIFSHAYPATLGSNNMEPLYVFSGGQATLGKVCVIIFFVISGFLITKSFCNSKSIVDYFVNRAIRIVPALSVVTMMMAFAIGPLITTESPSVYWTNHLTWRYIGNVLIYSAAQKLPGVFEANIYPVVTNASIWTISYEFTCYMLVAAIGLMFRRYWVIGLIIFGISLATIFFTYISSKIFVGFGSSFLAGSVTYIFRSYIKLDIRIFSFSIIVLFICTVLNKYLDVALIFFGSYCIFYLVYSRDIRAHNFARFGDFSYGTYLYAWPVQQIIAPFNSVPFFNFITSLPIVLVFAICSWKFVEYPLLSKKREVADYIKMIIGQDKHL